MFSRAKRIHFVAITLAFVGLSFAVQPLPVWGETLSSIAATKPALGGERRIALVIGNSAYRSAPLRNPVNDARAMARALAETGFNVTLIQDASLTGIRRAIRAFGDELSRGGVGLFFYAGHGMQVRGRNFLIPVNADIDREDEVEDQAVDANLVLSKMDTARNVLNIMILDACRTNPFARKFRAAAPGLTQMDAPSGTLIAFATAPGSVAADGDGENSTYTKHLLLNIAKPGLVVEQLFKQVRIGVVQETRDRQIPWESSSLKGDFYFLPIDAAQIAAERERVDRERIQQAVEEALRKEREKIAKAQAALPKPTPPSEGVAAKAAPPVAPAGVEARPAAATLVLGRPDAPPTAASAAVATPTDVSPTAAPPAETVAAVGRPTSAPASVAPPVKLPTSDSPVPSSAGFEESVQVRGLVLPKVIRVENPPQNTPGPCIRFLGGWGDGRWEGTRSAHEIWVERVDADCNATLIWAYDAMPDFGVTAPGYNRRIGRIREGKLMVVVSETRGTRVVYEFDDTGSVNGTYFRFGELHRIRLKRLYSALRPSDDGVSSTSRLIPSESPRVDPSEDPSTFIEETIKVGELVLPKKIRLIPPSSTVPENCRAFAGAWGNGRWDGHLAHEFWVINVNPDCSANVLYAWGSSTRSGIRAGYSRVSAMIRDKVLEARLSNGAEVRYVLREDGHLDATYLRGSNWSSGRFSRLDEKEIATR